jgi:Rrf2 family protein
MKVSKKTQYGLRALVHLTKGYPKKKFYTLKEISEKEDIPLAFLEKIFSRLEKAGFLVSKKGTGGGYRLLKDPSKTSVGEIFETLEGKIIPLDCSSCRKINVCSTKKLWRKIKESVKKSLYSLSLSDLI